MNSNEQHPATLQTLDELISALSEGERTTYSHIINSIKLQKNDFDGHGSWSEKNYTRNCIIDTEKFELILICWSEGHQTDIHDHGGEECWVKVIEGEFKETIYQQDKEGELDSVRTSIAKEGDVTYMKDFMGFHRLANAANKRSMSLHLYAKPIRTCNVFDEESKTFVSKNLCYNTTT